MNDEQNTETIAFEADKKTIHIKNMIIKDEEIYQLLQETEENKRAEIIATSIRMGIMGLKRMGVRENMDYVEKEFNILLSKIERTLDPSIETSNLGKLSLLIKEYFDKGGKVESIFDPMNGDTPIAILRREISREIRELRDEIIKKETKEEIIKSSPKKGYDFEDTCEEILNEIVRNHIGDELERKTNETGEITGCLSGDFVITLGDKKDKKIVVEVKDVGNISQPVIIETMQKAIQNRRASYGIFVVRYKEGMPRKIGFFNEFRGNIVVVALGSQERETFFPEVLQFAYQWAKLRLNTKISHKQEGIKILEEGIKQISQKLEVFSQIQRQCSNIDKSSAQIRQYSDDLKNDIQEQIKRIQKTLLNGEEDDR